ncbi:MAG TPA: hypothetical protein VGH58_08210 [Solirubrobacterales bacterium]|jgi:hypothetical protein
MIRRHAALLTIGALVAFAAPAGAGAAEGCEAEPSPSCFGVESVSASLSTTQAGAHPDLTLDISVKRNPLSKPNVFGLKDSYAAARNIRIETPPGLIGDPNIFGVPQQCTAQQLSGAFTEESGGCPNGSQLGVSTIFAYQLTGKFKEPVYMMTPPGGDVVARLGTFAGTFPIFIDLRLRSGSDYGLTAEVVDSPAVARLVELDTTLWGVPASPAHDTERCTPLEAFEGCVSSPKRHPSGQVLPFLTNPTRCGVPLEVGVNASSWVEPEFKPGNEARTSLPAITDCDSLPFGPSLEADTTSHHTSTPTGLDLTIKLPASEGAEVLEPSQIRYMRIDFPPGLAIDNGAADGLGTCSAAEVGFETDEASHCPDSAKLAATEFDVPVLERNLKGAIYLREPEPGDPFRVWIVADDLGLHIKLPGDLEVDKSTGQVHSIVLGAPKLEGIPQAPLREVKLLLKSGFRAPLITPDHCGTYVTHYEFVPWSGGPPAVGDTPMKITEGCDTGGFDPRLQAGSTEAQAGAFSPFTFTITRSDGEQNIAGLALALPKGLAASFSGVARCEGSDAVSGSCPPGSRIGRVTAAVGAGPNPLWVPQPGKRPTAVYLGGPYRGAPTSIVAVVPKQAGPFDFGDEVVRSAIYIDPETARATAIADPLPQFVEGIPLLYKALNVVLDRPHFALNPTSCQSKRTEATLTSAKGATAHPSSSYAAINCAKLAYKPKAGFTLHGGTHRGAHPGLTAIVRPRSGDANSSKFSIALPHSEFLDQGHIDTVCTRVQFASHNCPAGSIYGHAVVKSPLFDFPLAGPIYLRSSNHLLPDLVVALKGPPTMPIEVDSVGRIDSVRGGIRTTFEAVPDAPIGEIIANFPGGKKGLIENSENLCSQVNRVTAKLTAQNGKRAELRPPMRVSCAQRKGQSSRRSERR